MRTLTTLETLRLQRKALVNKMNSIPSEATPELRIVWKKIIAIDEQVKTINN